VPALVVLTVAALAAAALVVAALALAAALAAVVAVAALAAVVVETPLAVAAAVIVETTVLETAATMVFQEILVTTTRIAKQYQEQNILTGMSVMRELGCEKVSSPGPERHPGRIPPGKTAVAVELNFLKPVISFRQLIDRSRIHRLDER
jgi:hypothetical protein